MKTWQMILLGILALFFLLFLILPIRFQIKINEMVAIQVVKDVPLTADVTAPMVIAMKDNLNTTIEVKDQLSIALKENIPVPLRMDIPLNMNTDIFMNDTLDLKFGLPIDVKLTKDELRMTALKIPFKDSLKIKDHLTVSIPIKMQPKIHTTSKLMGRMMRKHPLTIVDTLNVTIPIDQKLYVDDVITLDPIDYDIHFKTTLPVDASVPISQKINVNMDMMVPVNQNVVIPLEKKVSAPVLEKFDAEVKVNNSLPVAVENKLEAEAGFSEPMYVEMEKLPINPKNISITLKKKDGTE